MPSGGHNKKPPWEKTIPVWGLNCAHASADQLKAHRDQLQDDLTRLKKAFDREYIPKSNRLKAVEKYIHIREVSAVHAEEHRRACAAKRQRHSPFKKLA